MAKAKVVLKEKGINETDGFTWMIKDKGDEGLCLTMALGYVAEMVVKTGASVKETTQLLKDMVKEEEQKRGDGTWL